MIIAGMEVKIVESTPSIEWGWEFVEKSNNEVVIVDRGSNSDVYETSVIVESYRYNDINNLRQYLLALRSGDRVTLEGINSSERLFGDMFNYSTATFHASLLNVTPIEQIAFNSFACGFSLRLASFPMFTGETSLPVIRGVHVTDRREQEWRRKNEVSYNNDTFISDVGSSNDIERIELEATLPLNDAISLQNFHRLQRGKVFMMRNDNWFIKSPFWEETYDYPVFFEEFTVEEISPGYRLFNITLRRSKHGLQQ